MTATTFNPLAAALLVAALASPAAADTPLHSAAGTGDTATLTALLAAGADPNARDSMGAYTPLHYAAAFPSHRIDEDVERHLFAFAVPALLAAGADPNACDSAGFTPLHHAAIHSKPAAVTLLLAAGADPNACDAEK